jgi:hypothetical protein
LAKKKKSIIGKIFFYLWLAVAFSIILYLVVNADFATMKKGLISLLRLFILVGAASFIGAIIEYKTWTRFILFIASPVTRFGRLPSISAASFITALFSQNAANTLIANSYRDGNMSHREMFISALCNAFPAMVSHSFRILFPLLTLIGIAAVWYYAFTFGVGILMTFSFLLISRILSVRKCGNCVEEGGGEIISTGGGIVKEYSWDEVLRKSLRRSRNTLFRLLYITAPIYLFVIYLAHNRLFDFWEKIIPDSLHHFLSPEIMTVFSARIGGLVNAAGIASEFLHQHRIEHWEIVVAFMIGNVLTNPIRTLRRNLPMAMGIFPRSDGFKIVFILQSLRMLATLVAIVLILAVFR